jgi:hypothetical protein
VPQGELADFLREVEQSLVPPAREFLIRAGCLIGHSDSSR